MIDRSFGSSKNTQRETVGHIVQFWVKNLHQGSSNQRPKCRKGPNNQYHIVSVLGNLVQRVNDMEDAMW